MLFLLISALNWMSFVLDVLVHWFHSVFTGHEVICNNEKSRIVQAPSETGFLVCSLTVVSAVIEIARVALYTGGGFTGCPCSPAVKWTLGKRIWQRSRAISSLRSRLAWWWGEFTALLSAFPISRWQPSNIDLDFGHQVKTARGGSTWREGSYRCVMRRTRSVPLNHSSVSGTRNKATRSWKWQV